MAVQPSDIVAQMRAALALTEPDLDTTVGTTTRKILDVVGEVVAEAYIDRYLLSYQYDIDAKSGSDLDDFVQLFGFSRLAAKRATGSISFERSAAAERETLIPAGTQVTTDDASPIYFMTLIPALMERSDLTVTVPAQAVLGGVRGNVGANTISRAVTPVDGVGTFTNPVAFTGGTEAESDDQLRTRFKRTVFRSMAGTEQMFLGTALEDPDVTQANVIGAAKRRREQVQIVSGTATSTLAGVGYVYPNAVTFGSSIDDGNIAVLNVHYSWNTSTRTVTILNGALPDGIYELEYDYVPTASRNNPAAGVTNRVDVYVNGERPVTATEVAIFRTGVTFNTSTGDPMNRANFLRPDGTQPTAGNYFIDLSMGPVLDVTAGGTTVTINGIVYTEGTHFFTVNDVTSAGGTSRSLSGFEFVSTANGNALAIPSNNQTFTANYVYNAIPGDVEANIGAWRLITTDVRAHAAKKVRLRLHMVAILNLGQVLSTVQPAIQAALSDYLNGVGFAGVVQVSDLLEAAASPAGVDAIRFKTDSDDPVNFAIQQVSSTGTVLQTFSTNVAGQVKRAVDVILGDDSLPVFDSLVLSIKAQNTWGTV